MSENNPFMRQLAEERESAEAQQARHLDNLARQAQITAALERARADFSGNFFEDFLSLEDAKACWEFLIAMSSIGYPGINDLGEEYKSVLVRSPGLAGRLKGERDEYRTQAGPPKTQGYYIGHSVPTTEGWVDRYHVLPTYLCKDGRLHGYGAGSIPQGFVLQTGLNKTYWSSSMGDYPHLLGSHDSRFEPRPLVEILSGYVTHRGNLPDSF